MRDRDEYAQQRDAPPLAEHGEGAPRALLAAKLVDRHGATGRLAAMAAEDERLDARGKRAATRHRSRSFTVAARRRSSQQLELVVAVLRPCSLIVPGIERALLPVGHSLDPARVDTMIDEVRLAGQGAAIAEREVVLVRAALITIPGDLNPHSRISLEDRDLAIEDVGVTRPDVRLVEVEVDHLGERLLEFLARAG